MRPLLSLPKSMLTVLVLLLALPGCILVVDEDDDDYYDYFYDHDWRLDVIIYYDRTLSADESYTISFETDGRLNGLADCNGYSGLFEEPRDGVLSIREIRSGSQYCGRQSMEDRYFEVLIDAASYRVEDDDLIITARNGDTLHFYKD